MAKDVAKKMGGNIVAEFRIKPGERVSLSTRDPADISLFPDKKSAKARSEKDGEVINALQDKLYAEGRRALLVVLQGMDTSGKDGTIRHVFKETGPIGITVAPFRQPSAEELAHDFLWRAHAAAPRRGFIGIFNRSHYEDVLVARVRKLAPAKLVESRYDQINAFEKILAENGITILKFMLHLSKDEQKKRLQARLDQPESRWKFRPDDLEDRKSWGQYQQAYEIMLRRCSTPWAEWHVIPSDHKWARNAAIAAIVRSTLEKMNPRYPRPDWDPKSFVIR
jgi:PPK2 family polyphosphate:nucleotide phosphotransferase